MQANKQKEAARAFAEKWKGRGYEKGESQAFWLELLQQVLGVANPYDVITFEQQVRLSHTSFIDAYIVPTKVLIEQKSIDKDLRRPIPQSDGTQITPFQQAKRYAAEMHRAHQQNDRAVMEAYGFPVKGFSESQCVARLFALYQTKIQQT